MKEKILEALELRSLGWSIIPIGKDKKLPLIKWKLYQTRLPTEHEIVLWFKTWPDANIGVVTGAISNLVVLDIDAKHNRSMAEFQLPPTVCSKTGGGGSHVFFRYPGKLVPNSNGSLFGVGVDIKGDAGYAILPPSSHHSGKRYQWMQNCSPKEMEIAEIPEWMMKAIYSGKESSDKQKLWQKDPSEIVEGNRNEAAASMAGKILSSLPSELIETTGWNNFVDWNTKISKPLSVEELLTVWNSIKKYNNQKKSEKNNPEKKERKSQTEILLEIIESKNMEFFHDERDNGYVAVQVKDHKEIWSCRGRDLKDWLCNQFWTLEHNTPSGEAIRSVIAALEGRARFEGEKIILNNRSAWKDNEIWYDLTNDSWQAVKITPSGWEISDEPPILFRRYSHHRSQVTPMHSGDASLIFNYVNITNPDHRLLLLVYIISCFVPDIGRAILIIFGSQGSAKSTLSKILRRIKDPSLLEVLSLPSSVKELIQILDHNDFVLFDNVSHVSEEISDLLCKTATGSGFSKRILYTDDEDQICNFKRSVGLNGISIVTTRADLLERSILIELERIESRDRKSEIEINENFERDLPTILGGIFDTLVKAIQIKSTINAKDLALPRMADFALWGCAISEALGFKKEDFLSAYQRNIEQQTWTTLNENVVGSAIISFMSDKNKWSGTASELLQKLTTTAFVEDINIFEKYWPKGSNILMRRINEIKVPLKEAGIVFKSTSDGKIREVTLMKISEVNPEKKLPIEKTDDTDGNF